MGSLNNSETRANLKVVLDRVVADRAPIATSRPQGEGVVMISASAWASIEQTLHLLQSPANAKALLASIADLDAGNGAVLDLIEP